MSDSAPATAAILTLGCKLNIADSEAMARRLREAGWRVVDRPADAEAVIVNSCSVTHVADQKSRHLVRLARRVAPKATVALTGCLLETASPPTSPIVSQRSLRWRSGSSSCVLQKHALTPALSQRARECVER